MRNLHMGGREGPKGRCKDLSGKYRCKEDSLMDVHGWDSPIENELFLRTKIFLLAERHFQVGFLLPGSWCLANPSSSVSHYQYN